MRYFILLFAVHAAMYAAPQKEKPADLLAKAAAAFERNLEQQKHWNWTTTENRVVLSPGKEAPLPSVVVESLIRKDGQRCSAVLSWSDGLEPYQLNGEAEDRCGSDESQRTPFQVAMLLKGAHAKLVKRSATEIILSIQQDKSLQHSDSTELRCTASIEATVRLDAATLFPGHLEGKVVAHGCEGPTVAELHYEQSEPVRQTMRRMMYQGTTFSIDYALQKDKFEKPERDYWIASEQHWSRPFQPRASALVFWNRKFDVQRGVPDRSLTLDSRTVAREFGTTSDLKFLP